MKRKSEPSLEVNLPITPFLDMSFQLLFFFIMSFNPNTAFEGHMALALPTEQSKQARDQKNVNPLEQTNPAEEIPFKSDVTVYVQFHANDPDHPTVGVEDSKGKKLLGSDMDELTDYLKTVRADATEKQGITVQGDGDLHWGDVVRVMDACRRAGFENVSFSPPPGFQVGGG